MPIHPHPASLSSAVVVLVVGAASAAGQESGGTPPRFGGDEQVAFAGELWRALAEARMVGDRAIQTHPYAGTSQHGPVIQYLDGEVTVGDRTGTAIVKRNYRGEDVTVEEIFANPSTHFDSLGVMFRREEGYAPESGDWFWVKYLPDGSVAATPDGVPMAGQVPPCISCHGPADGGDLVWSHDRFAR